MIARALKVFGTSLLICAFALPIGKLKYYFSSTPVTHKRGNETKKKAVLVEARPADGGQTKERLLKIVHASSQQHERPDFEYLFYCCQTTPEILVPPPRA